jgi:hypothetical protein
MAEIIRGRDEKTLAQKRYCREIKGERGGGRRNTGKNYGRGKVKMEG